MNFVQSKLSKYCDISEVPRSEFDYLNIKTKPTCQTQKIPVKQAIAHNSDYNVTRDIQNKDFLTDQYEAEYCNDNYFN